MDVVQQLANMGNEFIGWMQISRRTLFIIK